MESVGPIFHIGYHKTGTTFLQERLFEAFPEKFHRVSQRRIFDEIIFPNYFEFEENFESIQQFVQDEIRNAESKGAVCVFSNERLSGSPHTGGFDSAEIATRIKKLCPGAYVFIVVREQRAMIESCYNQYARAVGGMSLSEYLNPNTTKNKDLFHLDYFKYDRLVSHYKELFSASSTLVLPIELLKADQEAFIGRLLAFMRLDDGEIEKLFGSYNRSFSNKSLGEIELKIRNLFAPFILKFQKNVGSRYSTRFSRNVFALAFLFVRLIEKPFASKLRIKKKQTIEKAVGDFFDDSNRLLEIEVPFSLQQLGYRVK